jgi:hypothetical protein
MNRRNVSIDRLQIRLRGVSSQSARSAVKDIGAELLGQLATPGVLAKAHRRAIGKIEAGKFSVPPGTAPSELRELIARRIAESIKMKTGQRS